MIITTASGSPMGHCGTARWAILSIFVNDHYGQTAGHDDAYERSYDGLGDNYNGTHACVHACACMHAEFFEDLEHHDVQPWWIVTAHAHWAGTLPPCIYLKPHMSRLDSEYRIWVLISTGRGTTGGAAAAA